MIRLAGLVRIAAIAGALALAASCGGGHFDARATSARCGLDCAADELRYRLASSPRERGLYEALADIEEQRGRPTAALEALDAAEKLGRSFRGGLGGTDRARLARLLVARATARIHDQRAGGEADLTRARALGATIPAPLAHDAALIAIAGDLRHVDPARRKRGVTRLATVDAARAAALRGDGPPATIAATAAWLDDVRAYRLLGEMLDDVVRRRGVPAFAAMPGAADRWLFAHRWWSGPRDRPDVLRLEEAEAAGASPCRYPRTRGPCDVLAAGRSPRPDGEPWEPELVLTWERDGIRATDRESALAWMIVARRAVDRGQLASWDRAVRDHVDVVALAADPSVPAWARPAAYRLAARDDAPPPGDVPPAPGPALVVAAELAGHLAPGWPDDVDGQSWPAAAARLALAGSRTPIRVGGTRTARSRTPVAGSRTAGRTGGTRPDAVRTGGTRPDAEALQVIAEAYEQDPALADRLAAEVIARAVDVAEVAPVVARLFTSMGDGPRARAMWQRAVDASPEDAELALGLAIAMADAKDPAAGLQTMTRGAAGWGDAGAAMLAGARGFAAAGFPVEALTLARSALALTAPGDEAPAAALAAALLEELGRTAEAAQLRALAPLPAAWDGRDGRDAALAAAAAVDTHPAGSPVRRAALGRLALLATSDDARLARLAASLLRARLAPPRDPGVP